MGSLIVFMGATGAGKSYQAELLTKEARDVVHISSGDLLRRSGVDTGAIASGHLAPSGDVERLVVEAISGCRDNQTIILDGFPRSIDEAEWLDANLTSLGRSLDGVVVFDINHDTSMARLLARGRSDDTRDALEAKWQAYRIETGPVIDRYESDGIVTHVDGEADAHEITKRIRKLFKI